MRQSIKKSSTVLKALKVLEAVGNAPRSISLADVTENVGIDRTTAYRLLATLEEAGYVEKQEDTKRYRLSLKILTLGRNLLGGNLNSEIIQESLEALSRATNETTNLAVLNGTEMVLVAQHKASQLVAVDFKIGDRGPLYCSASGKAVLAHQDKGFVEKILANGLPKVASNTITTKKRLLSELERIRSDGVAIDDGELSDELRCLAAPVFESDGRVMSAIIFFGPRQRFTDAKISELSKPLVDAANGLSRKFREKGMS